MSYRNQIAEIGNTIITLDGRRLTLNGKCETSNDMWRYIGFGYAGYINRDQFYIVPKEPKSYGRKRKIR